MLHILLLLILGCGESVEEQRAKNATKTRKELQIGLTCSSKERSTMLRGVQLAMDEINSRGVLPGGKVLKLEVKEDGDSLNNALLNASALASDLNTIAVIGPEMSRHAISASSIYEFNGLVMMNPYSTATDLTNNKYEYIFRTIVSDKTMGTSSSNYFVEKGIDKVVICYVSDAYGKSFANSFENRMMSKGVDIVDRVSYDIGNLRELNRIVRRWENYEFNGILFVGNVKEGINFLKVVRDRDIDTPILFSETMVSDEILDLEPELVDNIFLPMLFNSSENRSKVKSFVRNYKQRYNEVPDYYAALGYDSYTLISQAIIKGKSFVPKDISKELKKMKVHYGVAYPYSFDEDGDLIFNSKMKIQSIDKNEFKYEGSF